MHYCQHFKTITNIKIPNSNKNMCNICNISPPLVWICMSKGCGFMACENNKFKHLYDHLIQMGNVHCIFINISSAEIRCINCKIQIYDIDQLDQVQYQKYKNSIDPYVFRIKYLPKRDKQIKIQNFIQLQNSEAHKKSRRGLCGLFENRNHSIVTSVIQLISNIPYYRHILKHSKLNPNKNQNNQLHVQLELFKKFGQVKLELLQFIQQFKKILLQRYPKLKGYKRKDPYQLFIYLLNCLNQEFKFYDVKMINNEIIKQGPIDQWKIIQQLQNTYSERSIIKQPLINEIQYTLYCKNCKKNKKILGELLNTEIQISKTKRRIKEIEIQFEKRNYQSPFKGRRRSLIDRILNTEQSQDSITLIQLIINYMNSQSSLDQKMKKCPDCGQILEIKQSRFHKLPKILLIRIYRLMKDGYSTDLKNVDYPNDILNLRGFIKQNYNGQTVYQFLSAICLNKENQYITVAKNIKNKQRYEFNNQQVKFTNEKYIPYILCYGLKNNSTLYHNIKSNIKLNISPQMPLPDFWLSQLKYFSPMPLLNPKVCKHNKIKPKVQSKTNKINYIPVQIYEALLQKFGGRYFQNVECDICLRQLLGISLRKKKQKQYVTKYDSYKCKIQCMLSTPWLIKWSEYLYKKKDYNYFLKNVSAPSIINNTVLLQNGSKCKSNLKKEEDFKVINYYVWIFFKELYGGGPQIQYKTKAQDKSKFLQSIDPQTIKEIHENALELKNYVTEQFYMKKQWDQSPISKKQSVSICSDIDLFNKSKEFD